MCGLTILHSNIRGLRANVAELEATIRNMESWPTIILLNKTKTPEGHIPTLDGYVLKGQRDRRDFGEEYDKGGGIVVFVRKGFEKNVSIVLTSKDAERLWACVQRKASSRIVSSSQ